MASPEAVARRRLNRAAAKKLPKPKPVESVGGGVLLPDDLREGKDALVKATERLLGYCCSGGWVDESLNHVANKASEPRRLEKDLAIAGVYPPGGHLRTIPGPPAAPPTDAGCRCGYCRDRARRRAANARVEAIKQAAVSDRARANMRRLGAKEQADGSTAFSSVNGKGGMVLCRGCGCPTPPHNVGSSGHCDDCRLIAMPAEEAERIPSSMIVVDQYRLAAGRRRGD